MHACAFFRLSTYHQSFLLDLSCRFGLSLDQLLLILPAHQSREGRSVVSDCLPKSALLEVSPIDVAVRFDLAQELVLPAELTHFDVSLCVALEEELLVLGKRLAPIAQLSVLHEFAVSLRVGVL